MTNKEIEEIKKDKSCIKISYSYFGNHKGVIYLKKSFYEKRKKKIDKWYKELYFDLKIEEISYNEFFMKQVSLIYKMFKRRDKFYEKLGYIKVYYNDGQPRFLNPKYHYDYIELVELSKTNSRIERLLKFYENRNYE